MIESLYTDQKCLVDVLLRVLKEWCFKCSEQKSFKSCLASRSRKMLVGLVRVLLVTYEIGIRLNAIVIIHIGGVLLMVWFGVGGWSAVRECLGQYHGLLLKDRMGYFTEGNCLFSGSS